jgi:hypothetical protein
VFFRSGLWGPFLARGMGINKKHAEERDAISRDQNVDSGRFSYEKFFILT